MVILKEITLKNFKSFKGESKIKVLPFTAIVGCNGAGKSNLMDAISFAIGVNYGTLRVSKIEELVHKSCLGEEQHEMSVMVVLQSPDGVEMSFKRSFQSSICQHRINDNDVSRNEYVEALEKLGIYPKIKNVLIFQNSIESIITKSPAERTAIFEDLSGSGSYANEYKRLQFELTQLKEELHYLQQNKRSITTDIQRMMHCKVKAAEYKKLEKKYEKAQEDLMLFNLYQIERDICQSIKAVNELNAKILTLESEKNTVCEVLKTATKDLKKHKYQAAEIEPKVKSIEIKLFEKVNDYMKIKTKVNYARSRVNSCQKSLESAIKADEAHKDSIKQLKDTLNSVEQKKVEYLQKFRKMMEIDLHLRESQLEEYERLEGLCMSEKLTNDYQRLMLLEREQKSLEDEMASAMTKKVKIQSLLNAKNALQLKFVAQAEKFEKLILDTKNELTIKRRYQSELLKSVETSKVKEQSTREELDEIRQQIADSKFTEKIKKENEIVNNLRQLFPGVLDRLRNMCHPIHNRYKVAVTKVLGQHLDSIVVENLKTASQCIVYLKEQHIGFETFLPLDTIDPEPLQQQLRLIANPPNVKLLYDVISSEPEIDGIIKFVTHNTLVCEIPEHAAEIASAAQNKKQHDCVSVDGTFHFKSGLISGGTRDIMTKAQRWDSSLQIKFASRQEELIFALRENRNRIPKEFELLISKIQSLEKNLNGAKMDSVAVTKRLIDIEYELEELEDDFHTQVHKCEDIETKLSESSKQIDELKSKIIENEKKFFASFCQKIGVDDIRGYEKSQNLFTEEIQNFDCQIDRIKEQLEFERTRNTEDNVRRWENNLREANHQLVSQINQERQVRDWIEEEKKIVDDYEKKYKSISSRIDEESDKLAVLRRKSRELSKEYLMLSKQTNAHQTLIEKRKAKRHSILTAAKIQGLKIPLINNSPDNYSKSSDSLDRSSSINESTDVRFDSNAKYDFSKLPRNLTTLESNSEIRAARESLECIVAEIGATIESASDPNMKASQQINWLKEKLAEINFRLEKTSKDARKANVQFERVKRDRYGKFMEFFEHASEQVDVIYKKLTRRQSAQAYLLPENPEEPYLGGIRYNCVPPGKRFESGSNLSGGEKTLAALSLIFATNSVDSPTFKVLDEIDAALDNRNTMKIVSYINSIKNVQQTIVISHKKEIFGSADGLIGIVPVASADGDIDSKIFTFNLRCYRR